MQSGSIPFRLWPLAIAAALTACGGGGSADPAMAAAPPAPAASAPASAPASGPASAPGPAPAPAPPPVSAPAFPPGDAVRGRAIYQTICMNCHAANPEEDRRGVRRAAKEAIIFAVQNINQMRFLRDTIGPQEAADLEVWLANPN